MKREREGKFIAFTAALHTLFLLLWEYKHTHTHIMYNVVVVDIACDFHLTLAFSRFSSQNPMENTQKK